MDLSDGVISTATMRADSSGNDRLMKLITTDNFFFSSVASVDIGFLKLRLF
jgi:hypothetical protein